MNAGVLSVGPASPLATPLFKLAVKVSALPTTKSTGPLAPPPNAWLVAVRFCVVVGQYQKVASVQIGWFAVVESR